MAVKNILSIFAGLSHSVYHSSRYEELHSVRPGQIRPQPGAVQKMVATFQSMNQLENQYRQNLKTIEKAKQIIVYKFNSEGG